MMETICGIDCSGCALQEHCKGCAKTDGRPFGGECVAAACYRAGGEKCFSAYKKRLMDEFNSLKIAGMPPVTTLCQLNGAFVNLEYTLPNGEKARLLDDAKIYLGTQIEKPGSERCFGLVADDAHLLVCEYGCNGAEPEIVVYQKRQLRPERPEP